MDTSKKLTKLQMKETQNYWKPRTTLKAATGKSLTYKGKQLTSHQYNRGQKAVRWHVQGTGRKRTPTKNSTRILYQQNSASKTKEKLIHSKMKTEFVAIQSALQEIPMEILRDERKGHQTGIKSIWTKDISTSNYTGTSLYPFFWI